MADPPLLSAAAQRTLAGLSSALAADRELLAAGDDAASRERVLATLARVGDCAALLDLEAVAAAAQRIDAHVRDASGRVATSELEGLLAHLGALMQAASVAGGSADVGERAAASPRATVAVLAAGLLSALSTRLTPHGVGVTRMASLQELLDAARDGRVCAAVIDAGSVAATIDGLDAIAASAPRAALLPLVAVADGADARGRARLHGATASGDPADMPALADTLLAALPAALERSPRLALIDADAARRARFESLLAGAGFEVVSVANCTPALIGAARADLLLAAADGGDAFALVAALRRSTPPLRMPLLLFADGIGEAGRAAALGAGADDLLPAALAPRALLSTIDAHLRRARNAPPASPSARVERRSGALRRGEFLAQLEVALRSPQQRWQVLLSVRLDQAEVLGRQLGIGAAYALEQALVERFSAVLARDDAWTLWLEFGFGVLLGREHRRQVLEVAERICRVIAEAPFTVGGEALALTVSVGVALPPAGDGAGLADRWFASAYAAQSIAHRLGGNRHDGVLDRESASVPAERVLIVREWAKEAAKGSNIVVEYQPMMPLHGAQPGTAYTLLAKLRDYRAPLDGVGRGEYLKPAREAGTLTMIDRVSLFNAFEAVDAQRQRGLTTRLHVPVDLASIDAAQMRWLEAQHRRRREAADALVIEFDADMLWADPALGALLQQVHDLGYALALSDASGSLSRIPNWLALPLVALRLPQRAVEGDSASVIELLAPWHGAGRCLVIDQVDGTEAVSRLWHLGVDFVQGDALAASSPRLDSEFDEVGG